MFSNVRYFLLSIGMNLLYASFKLDFGSRKMNEKIYRNNFITFFKPSLNLKFTTRIYHKFTTRIVYYWVLQHKILFAKHRNEFTLCYPKEWHGQTLFLCILLFIIGSIIHSKFLGLYWETNKYKVETHFLEIFHCKKWLPLLSVWFLNLKICRLNYAS